MYPAPLRLLCGHTCQVTHAYDRLSIQAAWLPGWPERQAHPGPVHRPVPSRNLATSITNMPASTKRSAEMRARLHAPLRVDSQSACITRASQHVSGAVQTGSGMLGTQWHAGHAGHAVARCGMLGCDTPQGRQPAKFITVQENPPACAAVHARSAPPPPVTAACICTTRRLMSSHR